jgi:hypothetical protein
MVTTRTQTVRPSLQVGGGGGGGRPIRANLPDRAETSQTRLQFNGSHSVRSGGWEGVIKLASISE